MMVLNNIKDAIFNGLPVKKICLGATVIWQRTEEKYLNLQPQMIWIVDELPQVVEVQSNTEWTVQ